ncbi:metalloregulator ArsR/SmtB family transcription factor [Paenibacillus chibensis]|uniref:Metalloregulator ArsR/SmtB family transcription factor n=1 Tax=Paenibacillus chibensis TaxID=59846 RepID=A0ABU6PNM2_9BACL|nr:metalloregulator ArsR/SmtB family transcription factor [Paenibacillus chibensis]MEC0371346.1 metalloregulator ArsR/SmtB family transcription factor [Paenibacillus chibensis]MED5016402.1 metalloregulator ArsR/SmtB family transcription factor [Paenibacillus chibensis]
MDQLTEAADKLKLLGDKTRLTILCLLKDREWCVCELVEVLSISQPGISQHMRKLKSHGIVNESRRGQWVYYSLNVQDKPYIHAVLDYMPGTAGTLSLLNRQEPGRICE